ncbi:lamin tail domain-containing protein [Amycolatopsis vancoresmycina]|uniref:lamin tail domain-containing protein n=1 Tax=Amycolatopsis vancoresmycina TaxID=208444 RepID=UPI000525713A|nr:lamin tail domain-containing protein [Amycolatopsis vancoresmycina]
MRRLLAGSAILTAVAGLCAGGVAAATEEQPAVSSSVVINEVSTRGPNGATDEFIEIRNVSNRAQDLTGYSIRVYGPGNAVLDTITLPAGMVLQPKGNPGQFVVLTGQNFSGTVSDQTNVVPFFLAGAEGIPASGGVAVFSQTGTKVDGVAFNAAASTPREGQAALPETAATEQLAAASARDILSTDTDNNRLDFSLHQRTPGMEN